MAFPSKFRSLLELDLDSVEVPDYAWMTYAVCGVTQDACGWNGWIFDGIFKKTEMRNATGSGDKLLPSATDEQDCPNCGCKLFRTEATIRVVPSADQARINPADTLSSEVVKMEYE